MDLRQRGVDVAVQGLRVVRVQFLELGRPLTVDLSPVDGDVELALGFSVVVFRRVFLGFCKFPGGPAWEGVDFVRWFVVRFGDGRGLDVGEEASLLAVFLSLGFRRYW